MVCRFEVGIAVCGASSLIEAMLFRELSVCRVRQNVSSAVNDRTVFSRQFIDGEGVPSLISAISRIIGGGPVTSANIAAVVPVGPAFNLKSSV